MFGIKRLTEKVDDVLSLLTTENRVVTVLERRIESLEKQQASLLNRVMTRSYGEYVLGTDVQQATDHVDQLIPPEADENNAGNMLGEGTI